MKLPAKVASVRRLEADISVGYYGGLTLRGNRGSNPAKVIEIDGLGMIAEGDDLVIEINKADPEND